MGNLRMTQIQADDKDVAFVKMVVFD